MVGYPYLMVQNFLFFGISMVLQAIKLMMFILINREMQLSVLAMVSLDTMEKHL